ncbi:hypothetical protein IJJ12_01495 [bacterium]|nr:hypothetical protein [bacterium]
MERVTGMEMNAAAETQMLWMLAAEFSFNFVLAGILTVLIWWAERKYDREHPDEKC